MNKNWLSSGPVEWISLDGSAKPSKSVVVIIASGNVTNVVLAGLLLAIWPAHAQPAQCETFEFKQPFQFIECPRPSPLIQVDRSECQVLQCWSASLE